jgi:outer membrane protein W
MKKITYALALSLLVVSMGYAQEFKKFKVGIALGYAGATGYGASGGAIVTLEPAYRLQDNFSVGLRLESALITRGYSQSFNSASINVAAIGSYTVNGQYYFSNNAFRPFAGIGLGLFSMADVKADVTSSGSTTTVDAAAAESKFGFYPRVGFDYRHFTISADYNIISDTKDLSGTGSFQNSYFGIRIGGFFGGGRK